jgi:hypothetical protein
MDEIEFRWSTSKKRRGKVQKLAIDKDISPSEVIDQAVDYYLNNKRENKS